MTGRQKMHVAKWQEKRVYNAIIVERTVQVTNEQKNRKTKRINGQRLTIGARMYTTYLHIRDLGLPVDWTGK